MFLTGSPGVGKTTVLLRVVEGLRANGYRVGGMISREVRGCGGRVGFEILDLGSGKRGWLAHVNQRFGPRIGKYRVNLGDLEDVGVSAILDGILNCDLIVVDEIGPMELFSARFKEAVRKAVESGKLVIGVAHWRARDGLIDEVKARTDAEVMTVTFENRDKSHETLIAMAVEFLGGLRKDDV